MANYDLKSLNLPKLYGRMLSFFTNLVSNPVTRPLIMGSLLENGGIPKLRKMVFDEEPTFYPLDITEKHASDHMKMPNSVLSDNRISREQIAYNLVRDYALAYREGKNTPQDVAEQVIKAIEQSSKTYPAMNAFSSSNAEDIRKQAGISTELFKKGTPRSFLEGVPVAVKDEIDQVPYPTTVGTKFLGANPPLKDSYVVARLRAAGALLVGKTNMHEIGIATNGENIHHGRIANPYDLQRDPGGSSNGSAAAVAAGIVPVAIGADGGGSIRVPAGLCGVVGLKPTFGRVSEAGAAPLCWSVAHLGPLGASVEDVAMVYQIIAGPDPQESLSQQQPPVSIDGWNTPNLNGLRLGIYKEWFSHANPEIVKSNEMMISKFEKAGAILVNVTIPELDAMRVAHVVTILSEMVSSMKNYPDHWKDFAPATRLTLELGKEMSSHDYIQAQRMRTRGINNFSKVFKEVDVILTPTTALTGPVIPPEALAKGWSDLSSDTEMMRFAFPGNLLGLPAISFPVGYDHDGMPIGMQAIGNYWNEALLLRVAYNAELTFTRALPKNYFGMQQL